MKTIAAAEQAGQAPMARISPSFTMLSPASERASAAARGSSKKTNNKPELLLRRALWKSGLRYRTNFEGLPGKPDIAFKRHRVAVFCDGDFWHGRDWTERKARLSHGNNAVYWLRKIERNMERDIEVERSLSALGWTTLRFWESDIRRDLDSVVEKIQGVLALTPLR
jgi:DNA mismatch endonuclease (patch repair protein)